MLSQTPAASSPRRRAGDRRNGRAIRTPRPSSAAGRERIAAALARRGARERLVLALLLHERLSPIEVASTLRLSLRQVERTYEVLIAELHRGLARAAARARSATRTRRAA